MDFKTALRRKCTEKQITTKEDVKLLEDVTVYLWNNITDKNLIFGDNPDGMGFGVGLEEGGDVMILDIRITHCITYAQMIEIHKKFPLMLYNIVYVPKKGKQESSVLSVKLWTNSSNKSDRGVEKHEPPREAREVIKIDETDLAFRHSDSTVSENIKKIALETQNLRRAMNLMKPNRVCITQNGRSNDWLVMGPVEMSFDFAFLTHLEDVTKGAFDYATIGRLRPSNPQLGSNRKRGRPNNEEDHSEVAKDSPILQLQTCDEQCISFRMSVHQKKLPKRMTNAKGEDYDGIDEEAQYERQTGGVTEEEDEEDVKTPQRKKRREQVDSGGWFGWLHKIGF